MFRESSDDVSEFAEVVGSYIHLLVNYIIPSVKIKVFPNQKPWVDGTVRAALSARTAAYNAGISTGDMMDYKVAAYGLRKTVKAAKCRYKDRVEADFNAGDPASVWKGLRIMTDFKNKPSSVCSSDPSLADELNTFFARFEMESGNHNSMAVMADMIANNTEPPFIVSESDVRRVFKGVNGGKGCRA